VGLLSAAYAATFVVAVLLHLGVRIPLGFAMLDEPRRPVGVFVEGTIALALALGAFAILARRTWAWASATGAFGRGDGEVLRDEFTEHDVQKRDESEHRRGAVGGDHIQRSRQRLEEPAQQTHERRLQLPWVVLRRGLRA
jgi:hypothetical protein